MVLLERFRELGKVMLREHRVQTVRHVLTDAQNIIIMEVNVDTALRLLFFMHFYLIQVT